MQIDRITDGAQAHRNEDWAGSFCTSHTTELVVIDGGTSVAERDYVAEREGDVVWFVARFVAALGPAIDAGLGQREATHSAIDEVRREFLARCAGQQVPLYAWPIAALSWVRVQPHGDGYRLELFCLGDCKVLLRRPGGEILDLDPFVNPQEAILRAEIGKLEREGVDDAAARQARLLPMLRARREYQNTVANTNSLCLKPNGGFGARTATFEVPAGSAVMLMSDGFYRLVDTYALHTPTSLFSLCLQQGLPAALAQLREHEATARAARMAVVKRADDASALLWRSDSPGV
ncbi:hypothetical protein [Massilia sp.]|uniref:hypothetical protein n=1 Tax=Massilia sp. TaxID=1882437 RepID=UPI00391A942A